MHRQRSQQSNAPKMQPAQGNQLLTGCLLTSASSKYTVQRYLGQGTFGTVVKCKRMNDGEIVAIKVMKSEHFWKAREEANILRKLKSLDSEKSNLVRWYQIFTDRGQFCLEFEHLDKSLYDFMRERRFHPLPLKHIRPIVKQLANALDYLRAAGIIHADIKLENVMLVNQQLEPFRVKVIDFGLSSDVRSAKEGSYIQTRPFRSPEVILGLPLTQAIDMWSLGCMVVFLYLGTLLYNGSSEYDVIRNIIKTQGPIPHSMLCQGRKTRFYFMRDKRSTASLWKLKNPEQVRRDKRNKPVETKRSELTSLDDLLYIHPINNDNNADGDAQWKDVQMFVNMVKEMLQLDTEKRITPSQLMQHRFIRMMHIINLYPRSKHVRESSSIMAVCQKIKAQGRSMQQPPNRTASPNQHFNNINPSSQTNNQTSQRSRGSWVNSKVVDVKKINTDTTVTNHPSMTATEVRSHLHMTNSAAWSHVNKTATEVRSHLNMAANEVRNHLNVTHTAGWSLLNMTDTAVKSDHSMTIKKKIAEYYDTKPKFADKKRYSDKSHPHTDSTGPTIPNCNRGTKKYDPSWDKSKAALGEDCDYDHNMRSDQKRQKAKKYSADRSTCNGNHDSTHPVRGHSDQRCRPEEKQPSHSTWNERQVWSEQKRKAGAPAGPHTSGCSNRPECTYTDQFHPYQRRRPDKHNHNDSPHPSDSTLTKRRVLAGQKRKMPLEEEVRPTKRICDHWLDDTQTIQRSSAAPPTSSCSDGHESTHTDHFHSSQRRGQDNSNKGEEDDEICMLMSHTPDVHILSPKTELVEDNTLSPSHPTSQGS